MGYKEEMELFAEKVTTLINDRVDVMTKQVSFCQSRWEKHSSKIEEMAKEHSLTLMDIPARGWATYVPLEFAREAALKIASIGWMRYAEED